jgi:hypothetical protein
MTHALLYPVFVQVALTLVLALLTAGARFLSVSGGKVKIGDIVLGQRAWPPRIQQLGNSLNNQWESPTLFYAVIAFALITGASAAVMLPLAWVWVALRIVHAGIHITSNTLQIRFMSFITGFAVLVAMWVVLALHVMGG